MFEAPAHLFTSVDRVFGGDNLDWAIAIAVLAIGLLRAIGLLGGDGYRANRLGALSLILLLSSSLGVLGLVRIGATRMVMTDSLVASAGAMLAGLTFGGLLAISGLIQRLGDEGARSGRVASSWSLGLYLLLAVWLGLPQEPLRPLAREGVALLEKSAPIRVSPPGEGARHERTEPARVTVAPAEANRLVSYHEPIENAKNEKPTAADSAVPPTPAVEPDYRFPQFNFTYTTPGKAWRRQEHLPAVASPDLRLFIQRLWPEVVFLINADHVTVRIDDDDLAAVVIQGILSRRPGSRVGPVTGKTVAGIEGMQFDVTAQVGNDHVANKVWVGQHAGVIYQFTTTAPSQFRERLNLEYEKLIAGFRLIRQESDIEGSRAAPQDYPPHNFAYRYVRGDPNWTEAAVDQELPWFSYFGLKASEGVFSGVVSIPLGDEPADIDRLSTTLLSCLDFSPQGADVTEVGRDLHRLEHARNTIDYRALRSVDGVSYSYALRVVHAAGGAHLITAWAPNEVYQIDQKLWAAVDRFELTGEPPASEPPVDPALRKAVASLLNELAIVEYGADQLRAAQSRLEIATRYDPNDLAYASNLVEVLVKTEGPATALDWLEKNGAEAFGPVELASAKAELLLNEERFEEALAAYAEAARTAPLDDETLKMMANVAVVSGRYDEVLEAIDQAIARRDSPLLRRWRATLLGKSGQHDLAIAGLSELHAQSPEDAKVTFALAEAYEEAERFEEGIRVCSLGVDQNPESTDFLYLLGRMKLQTEDYDGARDALERCLKLSPGDAEASELLRHVTALLGRGDNRLIREPIDPVPLPDEVANLLASAPPVVVTPEVESTGYYFTSHTAGYEYRPGERRRETVRKRFKVINRHGAEETAVLSHSFNPLSERVFVNELVVRDEHGTEIGRGLLKDYYVLDDQADGLDTYEQVVKIPVPGVRPGCTVDLTVTRESLRSQSEFGFETQFLTGQAASSVRAVYLVGDVDAVAHRAYDVAVVRPTPTSIAWVRNAPPRAVYESHQRDLDQFLPTLHLSDASRRWSDLGMEYAEELQPTLEPDPDTERLAHTLCADCRTDAERIDAIARHVQTAITYHGLEFGVRGVIPHEVGHVYRTGKGDCKDHSLLTHHLLRAVGIRSHLALANTSGSVVEDLPSLDQFDHMVLVVPNMPLRNGGVAPNGVLDLTQKGFDSMLGLPPALGRKRLLVLDPENPHLVSTGGVDASYGWIDCQREAVIVPQHNSFGAASLSVAESVTFGPQMSSLLRLTFEGATAEQRRQTLRRMIGENRSVRVSEVTLAGVEDVSEPLVIRCRYTVADAFQEVASAESLLVGAMPNHWATLYCAPDQIDQRRTPFEFMTPVTFRSKTRLNPPEGYRVVLKRDASMGESTRTFSWKASVDPTTSGAYDLSLLLRRPAGVYPAEQYRSYEASANRALRLSCKALTIAAKEPTPTGPAYATR